MKDRYEYIAVFHYADDGISISFPDLPGCLPCAYSTEEAIKNAKEAMGLHLWGMENDKCEIPEPTPITGVTLASGEVPMLVEIFMPPIREKINTRFVKKTLSLPGWLAAREDEVSDDQLNQWRDQHKADRKLAKETSLTEQIQNQYGKAAVKLLERFIQLNKIGRDKALENISDLAELEKYT